MSTRTFVSGEQIAVFDGQTGRPQALLHVLQTRLLVGAEVSRFAAPVDKHNRKAMNTIVSNIITTHLNMFSSRLRHNSEIFKIHTTFMPLDPNLEPKFTPTFALCRGSLDDGLFPTICVEFRYLK